MAAIFPWDDSVGARVLRILLLVVDNCRMGIQIQSREVDRLEVAIMVIRATSFIYIGRGSRGEASFVDLCGIDDDFRIARGRKTRILGGYIGRLVRTHLEPLIGAPHKQNPFFENFILKCHAHRRLGSSLPCVCIEKPHKPHNELSGEPSEYSCSKKS